MFLLRLQEFIHRFEVGGGQRGLRIAVAIIAFVGLAVLYDALLYRNLASEEAMDVAQVGRNLAEGQGFSTKSIRPFSMYLLRQHREDRSPMLNGEHPDLAHAPVYPALLSLLFRVVPEPDLGMANFSIARRDLAIAILNQVLLLLGALLVYMLAGKWFDQTVASVAAILFAATELYWKFSVSGLSSILLIDLVLLLAWCLASIERRCRENESGKAILLLAGLVGLIAGVAMMTRYACGFLIVPAALFLGFFCGVHRKATVAVALTVFVLVISPWVSRNVIVSGTPFGVAGYAALEQTRLFPEDRLQRSSVPELTQVLQGDYVRKFVANTREVVQNDLPTMGGNWLWSFFLVGLLVRFQSPTLSRMRWFLMMALVSFIPVQAMGKTHIWTALPVLNSENLLVLVSPLLLIFGVGLFFVLLETIELPTPGARRGVIISFVVIISFPLLAALPRPRPSRLVYPPYFPPRIQQVGRWLEPHELMMSDVPSAVAWYGNRQTLWLTLNSKEEFLRIHDFEKPIKGLYLTTRTTAGEPLVRWMQGDRDGWGPFLVESLARRQLPEEFPLRRAPEGLSNEGQLLLMDYERWRKGEK